MLQFPKSVNSTEPKMEEPSTSTTGELESKIEKIPLKHVIKPHDSEEESWAFIKEICSMYENGITSSEETLKMIPSISERIHDFENNYNNEEQEAIIKFLYFAVRLEKASVFHDNYFSHQKQQLKG